MKEKERLDLEGFGSLSDIFEYSLKKFGSLEAYSNMGQVLTFEQTDQLSLQFAAYLQVKLGLKIGDKVAIMMPNLLQYPIALLGILRAGLTVVNVNPLYTGHELSHQLKDSESKAIVILSNFAHILQSVLSETQVEHVMVTDVADMLSFPQNKIVNFMVKHVKKIVPKWHISHAISFLSVIKGPYYSHFVKPDISYETVAFLQYTGGTTGVSKGAVLTHGNMVSNLMQIKEWIQPIVKDGEEVVITALPLYHIFSLTVNLLLFNLLGGKLILITNPRDISVFVKTLQKNSFSMITGVNTLYNALLNDFVFKSLDFSRLKLAIGGGMAVQKSTSDQWHKLTGKLIIEGYGLTETSAAVSVNSIDTLDFNGSVGFPFSFTEVSVRDDAGQSVSVGMYGELWVRGPQVMKEYYNRPAETADVLTSEGWLKTGDIVALSQEGSITLVDRKKDMIIVSGFNVYPSEIEDIISNYPGILDVAVIGVEDEHSGEVVKVICSLKDKTITSDDIMDHCKQYLTGYKCPKYIEFRDELPKTNVGKILRRELRDTVSV